MPADKYTQLWEETWNRVRSYNNIDAEQVNAFFSRLQPQAFSEGFLMLTADTDFIKKWVETNYSHLIKQALEEQYGVPFTVAIEVHESAPYAPVVNNTPINTPVQSTQNTPLNTPPVHKKNNEGVVAPSPTEEIPSHVANTDNALISEYSFDNFVVGESNRYAYSMALSVAEKPGNPQLNPLFIYGKSGLGKTHLLRAIQNYVALNYPTMKTVYVDSTELVNDYTNAAIRGGGKEYNIFMQRYMDADIVLIDDVQGLQGKTETINAVFSIFKHLTDRGKQIILSADRAPKNIDLEERVKTRFNQGTPCDIQPPEMETKLGIIKKYIEDYQDKSQTSFEITPEIQEYVAQISGSNIRELKSAINRIILYGHSMGKTTISIEEVSQLLKDHFSGGPSRRIQVSDIQNAVEEFFHISHADLIGSKRSANISHARQVAVYLCRTMIDIPFTSIGKEFGNRDHTTIMYGVTQIEEKCKESQELNEEIEIIKKMIME